MIYNCEVTVGSYGGDINNVVNYAQHYTNLINRSKNRLLVGYKESHHIVPRCLGGKDTIENLVDLTAEEHFVAHQLLVKMHPKHKGLVRACVAMHMSTTGQVRNNKLYAWLRKKFAANQTGRKLSDNTKKKLSDINLKRPPITEETRQKLRDANKRNGIKPPSHKGKTRSAQWHEAIQKRWDEKNAAAGRPKRWTRKSTQPQEDPHSLASSTKSWN